MIKYLARYLDKKFCQFIVFGEYGPFMSKIIPAVEELGIKTEYLPGLKSAWGVVRIPKLIKFIRKNKIDLIHAHGSRVNLWGSLASLLTGVPIIFTEPSIDFWRENNFLYKLVDILSMRRNSIIVGVTPAVCAMLAKQGVRPDKIVCINNSVDVSRFSRPFNTSLIKTSLAIPEGVKIIGTVGRLVEPKGHKYLLEAAALVTREIPEVRFIIVGGGHLEDILKSQAAELGLNGKVIFTGSRTDIPEMLAIMDIFVMSSIKEGLPIALLEAMASEKPIVATKIAGIPDVIKDGVEGLLIPPGNPGILAEKITYLLKNPGQANKLAAVAKKNVCDNYDVKIMISNYQTLYAKILSK